MRSLRWVTPPKMLKKVFRAAQIDDSVKTPLNEQLDRLGGLISKLGYGIALAVLIGRIAVYFWGLEVFE